MTFLQAGSTEKSLSARFIAGKSRVSLFLACLLVGVATGYGQSPTADKLSVTADTVIVDVVVKDKRGQAVGGLDRKDFSLKEDGHAQVITSFDPHHATEAAVIVPPSPLPPGTYTNKLFGPPGDVVDVLLIDALNTETKDQAKSRLQMVKYLKGLPADRRVAVFTLASRLRLVQDFTQDPRLLSRLGLPQQSAVLQDSAERDSQLETEDRIIENGLTSSKLAGIATMELASLQQFEADQTAFQTDMRVRITLDALQQISRYLANIPGRKNLIWLSGSFPISLFPDPTLKDPYRSMRDYSADVRSAAEVLAANRIAVYPVDARGLFPEEAFAANRAAGSSARSLDRSLREETRQFAQQAAGSGAADSGNSRPGNGRRSDQPHQRDR